MKLDYNPKHRGGTYILEVNRSEADVRVLMREHGLDMSTVLSTSNRAVLFTREPYAAVSFGDYATPKAAAQLGPILTEIASSWQPDSKIHVEVPADKELWGFQKADIEYARRRKNTLVGDQPGLGKTQVAIAFANDMRARRILVVCPASIRLQWERRIREWSTIRWPLYIHPILKAKNGTNPHAHYTICSYELARNPNILSSLVREGRFDLVVLDECHYCQTTDSLRSRAVFGDEGAFANTFTHDCGAILGLSGTPLLNRPRNVFNIARGLCYDSVDWLGEDAFCSRFNPRLVIPSVDPVTGYTKYFVDERSGRHAELQNRLRGNFMVRHLKRDVMPQLKLPKYDLVYIEENGAIRAALEAESLLDIDFEHWGTEEIDTKGHVMVVRHQMGLAMAPGVADYVDTLLEGGEDKLVLFGWHKDVLDCYEERLAKWGVLRIDGRTSPTRKDALVRQYVGDDSKHCIIGNMQSMGTGTDGLQEVSAHAVIGEPDWTPTNNEQAISRLDRGGQTRTVQGDICVVQGSYSEKILADSLRKGQINHRVLDRKM